jgi:hypothetical protein
MITKIVKHLKAHILIYCGLAIHLLFYLSIFQTRWLDIFFTGNSLHHCCQGMDFYQVPRGADAFLHGGSLSGDGLPENQGYAHEFVTNANVYHPLFTLVVGSYLALFPANISFHLWIFFKLVITLTMIFYFYQYFKTHKYVDFAIFVLLVSTTQYQEIAISQYQFVLNVFLLLMLITIARGKSKAAGGFFYFCSLLVKPVGILWVPTLLRNRQWKIAVVGIIGFLLGTGIFLYKDIGKYYLDNLTYFLSAPPLEGPDQIVTLASLLKFSTPLDAQLLLWLQRACLVGMLLLSCLKRVHVFKAIFLAIAYYLLFYNRVYEYHYTTLAPILAFCVLYCPEFQTKPGRIFILLTCLPSAFVVMRLLGDVTYSSLYGYNLYFAGWQVLVVSKIIPVLLLTGYVLRDDVVFFARQGRLFAPRGWSWLRGYLTSDAGPLPIVQNILKAPQHPVPGALDTVDTPNRIRVSTVVQDESNISPQLPEV